VTRAFTWTEKRDADLARLVRDGVSAIDIADVLGCSLAAVTERRRELQLAGKLSAVKPRGARDVGRVPRPVAVRKPGLIDISKAPSSMERAADKWAGRE
jgi:hypothetical protein